jgi:hypothetical protein
MTTRMGTRTGLSLLVGGAALAGLTMAACASAPVNPPPPIPETPGTNVVATSGTATPADTNGPGWGIMDPPPEKYSDVVHHVVGMVNDTSAQEGVRRRGLNLINLMWEDTGRSLGSAVGPNISDLTLMVRYHEGAENKADLLPVIRFPNFTDRTGDIPADRFLVRVGNQKKGGQLESVPLTDVLKNLKGFVTDPSSIRGSGNFLDARDTHFLASAQAVFLPIPKEGKAEFTPVLFNYQSSPGSPAVLTLLITRQGTSMTVVENDPGSMSPFGRGQELMFNNHGQRAPFTAERKSDVKARIEAQGGPKTEDDRSALARGADVLFLVQIPLKHRAPPVRAMPMGAPEDDAAPMTGAKGAGAMSAPAKKPSPAPAPPAQGAVAKEKKSDMESAVLGHGADEGVFLEGKNLLLERDPTFPIRVTVQFYKATSNGVVSDADLDAVAATIGNVFEHADFVGSLVIPDGDPRRPTAWAKMPPQLFPW